MEQQNGESELYISCRGHFAAHFLQASARLKGKRGEGGDGDAALLAALNDYLGFSSAFDPFGRNKDKAARAGEKVEQLLKEEFDPASLSLIGRERAEKLLAAADGDAKADFEAMVTYLTACGKEENGGREPQEVLADFYREARAVREEREIREFCRRDRTFEEGRATGFPVLDSLLDGGLYPGLYVLGAPSSAGKTSFCMQLCAQLAERGTPVLFFSLEMSGEELRSKTLSRLTFLLDGTPKKSLAKSERKLTSSSSRARFSEAEWELLGKASAYYLQKIAPFETVKEGNGDYGAAEIARETRAYLSVSPKKPVVFVDYLQILKPRSESMTDKQNIDRNVSELRRLCRDEKITVFAISSFNRASYNQIAGLEAFKESGAIEYSADAVFALQPEGMRFSDKALSDNKKTAASSKKRLVRPMLFTVLKNRRGKCGDSVLFDYHCAFGHFAERGICEPEEEI